MHHHRRPESAGLRFLAWVVLGSLQWLYAQAPIHLNLARPTDDFPLQLQLRACRAGAGEAKELADDHWGGGVSGMLNFGDAAIHPRLRLDLDEIPRRDGNGNFGTAGLGLDAVVTVQDWGSFAPLFSCGPALQRWSTAGVDPFGRQKHQVNKLAARVEAGSTLGEHATLTLGCLYGSLDAGRRASIGYLALTFQL